MKTGHVCIVTPGHLATNPRVVKEASTICAAGCKVTVVHGDYLPSAREIDPTLTDARWTRIGVPFGPHQASRFRYFAQTIRRKTAQQIVRTGLEIPTFVSSALSPVSAELTSAAMAVRADLYIAHYVAALPAAARAARQHHASYAFDAEDFHVGDLPDEPRHAMEKWLIQSIEALYLPGAAYVTAASPGIAAAYASKYEIALPTVVLNAFPRDHAPARPTANGTSSQRPSLYWFSQTIGPDRGLECAVSGIARARTAPHLHLRGTASSDYQRTLRQQAAALGVADRIHFHTPAPPNDMVRLAATYDAGLVSETGMTENRRIALTNKQFTYLLAGAPAVMSDVPAHVAFSREAPRATFLYRTGDPESLASCLDDLFGSPDRLTAARQAAHRLGQERFNFESEAPALLAHVADALKRRQRRGT